jgi:hypothetical protein
VCVSVCLCECVCVSVEYCSLLFRQNHGMFRALDPKIFIEISDLGIFVAFLSHLGHLFLSVL